MTSDLDREGVTELSGLAYQLRAAQTQYERTMMGHVMNAHLALIMGEADASVRRAAAVPLQPNPGPLPLEPASPGAAATPGNQ